MNIKKNGPINIIFGENGGRFPYVNSVLIESRTLTIIDPHSNKDVIKKYARKYPDALIFHSHFHSDHIRYSDMFEHGRVFVHKEEAPVYKSIEALERFTGIREIFGKEGIKIKKQLFRLKIPLYGEFVDGEQYQFDETRFIIIHTPGHSPGHSCFYFPEEAFLYLADIDLTEFGPWYGNPSANLTDFIKSINKVATIEANHYLSGHEAGLMNRETFLKKLKKFTSCFSRRDDLILNFLKAPRTIEEIVERRFIYGKRFAGETERWISYAEKRMIEQHLKSLIEKRMVRIENDRYVRI